MSTEAVKKLSDVNPVLKGQLEGFSPNKLKHTSTDEKINLPTQEGKSIVRYFEKLIIIKERSQILVPAKGV